MQSPTSGWFSGFLASRKVNEGIFEKDCGFDLVNDKGFKADLRDSRTAAETKSNRNCRAMNTTLPSVRVHPEPYFLARKVDWTATPF